MSSPGFEIRHLHTQPELRSCVGFQKQIWGENFGEVVPAAILWVAVRTSGIVAGAFDESGAMAGFVFGMTGFNDDGPYHWSDMLAVRADMRGKGLGRALKNFQRNALLERGISTCNWTVDPLQAANAHFNFNVLGATSKEYVPDCYGESDSPLHAGLPTDRLIMNWELDSDRVRTRMVAPDEIVRSSDSPILNPDGAPPDLERDEMVLRVVIPRDAQRLKKEDPNAASRWQQGVRTAFVEYFGRGYTATGVAVCGDTGESCYLLSR